MRSAPIAATIATIASIALVAATPDAWQQTAPAPETRGTGRISGNVVDGKTQPVRSAIVTLTGTGLGQGRAAITDDKGSFTFDALPAGRFTLTSSKPAYLNSSYGAMRPGGAGTPVALAEGQQLRDLTLSMPRGSVITGVVRDSAGTPVPAIQVSVVRANAVSRSPARPESVSTDDRGAYRIYGLTPGRYLVYADRGLSGGIGGIGMMSATDIDATFARLKQRGVGAAPASTSPSPSSVVRPTATLTPAPVFHPGVTSPGDASPVELGLEQVREGVDIVYRLAPTLVVSGTVSGAGGQNVQVGLVADGGTFQSLAFGSGPMLQRRTNPGDGEFTFTNVLPGKYTLTARTSQLAGRGGAPAPPAGPLLSASTVVEVSESDVTGLVLALQRMPSVSGRVVFEGATQPQAAAIAATTVRLNPEGAPTTPSGGVIVATGAPGVAIAVVQADGTFEMPAVQPGSYRLTLRAPAGWTVRSAQLAGRDVLDLPLQVPNSDISGLEIRFSDRQTQLSGRLLHTDGTPAPGYFVIAFSADRSSWFPDSRRLLSVRPGTDGAFRFDNMPAGEYYLAALLDADSAEWQSPDFLEQVMPSAVKVAIADGERKTQELRIRR